MLLATGAIAAVALASFLLSTSSSLFAVRELEVSGASPTLAAEVRGALGEARGSSLVGIDLDRLGGLVEALPAVARVSFDRAFPHTLRVRVVPERVVGVVRQGKASYLVSARGRVVGAVARGASPSLPRIWARRTDDVRLGGRVPSVLLPAVHAVAPLGRVRFPARVASVRPVGDELRLRLATGLDVRLGTGDDLVLKLTVAGKVLPLLREGATYLDVSVPERPVAGTAGDLPEASPSAAGASAAADPPAGEAGDGTLAVASQTVATDLNVG